MRDFYDVFGFELLINEPTRVTPETKTLIDHIAATNTNNIVESGVTRLGVAIIVLFTVFKNLWVSYRGHLRLLLPDNLRISIKLHF